MLTLCHFQLSNQSTFIVGPGFGTLEVSRRKLIQVFPSFFRLPLITAVIRASVEGYHTHSQVVNYSISQTSVSMFSVCVQEILSVGNDPPMFRSFLT